MSADDNFLKILEKVTEVQVQVGELRSDMNRVKEDIHEIREEDRRQNELLAEHIAGVKTNAERLNVEREARIEQHEQTKSLMDSHKKENDEQFKKFEDRVSQVEFLPKLAEMLRKAVLWIGAPAGVLYTVGRILGWF